MIEICLTFCHVDQNYFAFLTHSGVLVETLQYVPTPVPVFAVVGESVHVEQTLNGLRSQ